MESNDTTLPPESKTPFPFVVVGLLGGALLGGLSEMLLMPRSLLLVLPLGVAVACMVGAVIDDAQRKRLSIFAAVGILLALYYASRLFGGPLP